MNFTDLTTEFFPTTMSTDFMTTDLMTTDLIPMEEETGFKAWLLGLIMKVCLLFTIGKFL